MAKSLLEWETIDKEQIDDIMEGRQPRPPKDWAPRTPSGGDSSGTPPAAQPDPAPSAA
jgi:cell division protease FtsH